MEAVTVQSGKMVRDTQKGRRFPELSSRASSILLNEQALSKEGVARRRRGPGGPAGQVDRDQATKDILTT